MQRPWVVFVILAAGTEHLKQVRRLHGNPTSSYLWRNVIPYLANQAIAFMESSIDVPRYETMPASIKIALGLMRTNFIGGLMVKSGNLFIKKMLPDMIVRKLVKEEMDYYAGPYPNARSRKPLHRWPQDVPVKGKPEFGAKKLGNYARWLKKTEIPKLCFYVTPGVGFQAPDLEIVKNEFKNTTIIKLGEGLHFLQEDYPHEIGEGISTWYKEIS